MSDPIILLLSGPNLNLLGTREPLIYGDATLADHVATATESARTHGYALEHVQSAAEADLVAAVHGARDRCAGIIVNGAALTHYGWSLHDALSAFDGPVVELHLSQTAKREPWRHDSVLSPVADGIVQGFGGAGYRLAVEGLVALMGQARPR